MPSNPKQHWDAVYDTKSPSEVSWYQVRPELSLALIQARAPDRWSPIIDIGCGASSLLGALATEGYDDLTAVDASAVAVAKAKVRYADLASRIRWIVADITQWMPERRWRVWHDRAVFHFLIETADQDAYVGAMSAALETGATAIIATFALDGPATCSGLPVERYSGATMAKRLGAGFRLVSETPERHLTPKGAVQRFGYCVFERL
jgi:SAM-dependent methyltransferase